MPEGCALTPSPPEPGALLSNRQQEWSQGNKLVFISPMQPFLGLRGLAGSQDSQEGTVVAMEVGGSWLPEPSPQLAVSLAEGTAGTEHSHASPPWETALAEKGFFQAEGICRTDLGLLDGPSRTWLPSRMWGSHLRTQDQLGPLKAAVFCGTGVEQKPAPLKAELSPS